MTEKEKQFEERLDSLILLKALLIKDNEFDEVAQKKVSTGMGESI